MLGNWSLTMWTFTYILDFNTRKKKKSGNFYKLIESIGNSMLFRRKVIYASLKQVIKAYSYHFPNLLCSVITTSRNKQTTKEKISLVQLGLNWAKSWNSIQHDQEKNLQCSGTFLLSGILQGQDSLSYVPVTSSEVRNSNWFNKIHGYLVSLLCLLISKSL